MSETRGYVDLRHKFIRGLIPLESFQRSRHYFKSAAECTSRAIVSLDLCDIPLKSVKQATQLEGIGNVLADKLKDICNDKDKYAADPPGQGRFVSSAPALLLTLLNMKEDRLKSTSEPSSKKVYAVSEASLCKVAAQLCEEKFLPADSTGFCIATWRLNILCSRGMVKKRTVNKKPVYELLPYGEQVALHLRGETSQPVGTSPLKNKRLQPSPRKLQDVNHFLDALYTNDTGQDDGVILLVDTQEWGGDAIGLSQLTRMIDQTSLTYRTKRLKTGDYQWIYRYKGIEYCLPFLVERKRGDDLANSIVDGRFFSQIDKMKAWSNEFVANKGIEMNGKVKYLIEGDLERYVVRCQDGCQGVGKCGNPPVDALQEIIEDLDCSTDFSVIRTQDIQTTVDVLVMLTADIKQRMNTGDFDVLFPNGFQLKDTVGSKENNNNNPGVSDEWVNYDGKNVLNVSRKMSTKSAALGKQQNSAEDSAENTNFQQSSVERNMFKSNVTSTVSKEELDTPGGLSSPHRQTIEVKTSYIQSSLQHNCCEEESKLTATSTADGSISGKEQLSDYHCNAPATDSTTDLTSNSLNDVTHDLDGVESANGEVIRENVLQSSCQKNKLSYNNHIDSGSSVLDYDQIVLHNDMNQKPAPKRKNSETDPYTDLFESDDDLFIGSKSGAKRKIKPMDNTGDSSLSSHLDSDMKKSKFVGTSAVSPSVETSTAEPVANIEAFVVTPAEQDLPETTCNESNVIVVAAEIHSHPAKSDSTNKASALKPTKMWRQHQLMDSSELDRIEEAPIVRTPRKVWPNIRDDISPNWTEHRSVLDDNSPPKQTAGKSQAVKDLYDMKPVNDLYLGDEERSPSMSPILTPSKFALPLSSTLGTPRKREINFSDILKQDVIPTGNKQSPVSLGKHRSEPVEIDSDDDSLPDISPSKSTDSSPDNLSHDKHIGLSNKRKSTESPTNKLQSEEAITRSVENKTPPSVLSAPKFESNPHISPMDTGVEAESQQTSSSSFNEYRSPSKTSDKWKHEIETIHCIVPQATLEEMARALEIHFGNVENAIGMLLDEYM
ncbi:uncharacterized protein LOC141898842 [Tubulanus polymorphus]|uniref:uncharacterized protein LOC141898842 n=1 Tax=Tubulanus polymorphus TaxID=672921 RepID=UPI003DA5D648